MPASERAPSAAVFSVAGVSACPAGRAVLDDVSFEVRAGERVVVLGVNGCGKTTLLRLLDGLAFPDAGEVRYAGQRLEAASLDEPVFRRRFRGEVALLF